MPALPSPRHLPTCRLREGRRGGSGGRRVVVTIPLVLDAAALSAPSPDSHRLLANQRFLKGFPSRSTRSRCCHGSGPSYGLWRRRTPAPSQFVDTDSPEGHAVRQPAAASNLARNAQTAERTTSQHERDPKAVTASVHWICRAASSDVQLADRRASSTPPPKPPSSLTTVGVVLRCHGPLAWRLSIERGFFLSLGAHGDRVIGLLMQCREAGPFGDSGAERRPRAPCW